MNTPHTMAEALIVASLAAVFGAWLYFRHRERQQRLEVMHRERLAAIEKGIPLLELPLDPPAPPKANDAREVLLHGIVWLAFGIGGMIVLAVTNFGGYGSTAWAFPLPLVLLGGGLVLYYVLARDRAK